MKVILFFLIGLLATLPASAQSLGLQQVGSLGGELGQANGPSLIGSSGAVASSLLAANELRLDHGFFPACDLCEKKPSLAVDSRFDSKANWYPNPTQGALFVEIPTLPLGESAVISVYDQMGRIRAVPHQREGRGPYQIDLHGLPAGVYLIRIQSSVGIITDRIIKQ